MAMIDDDVRALLNTNSQEVFDGLASAWEKFQAGEADDEPDPVLILVIGGGRHWMARTFHPTEERNRLAELGLLDLVKYVLMEDLNAIEDLD